MPTAWSSCMSGVPAFAAPKMSSSVGRSGNPTAAAPPAWSIRANTVMPLARMSASSRSIVSFGPNLLGTVVKPSAAMALPPNSKATTTIATNRLPAFRVVLRPLRCRLLRLHLHRLAQLSRRTRHDDEVAARGLRFATDNLTNWPNRIDDRRARRVGREARQRLEGAGAVRTGRQREHVGMLRLETGDRRLENLNKPLVEQCHAGRRLGPRRQLASRRRHRQVGCLAGDAQGLQPLRSSAF